MGRQLNVDRIIDAIRTAEGDTMSALSTSVYIAGQSEFEDTVADHTVRPCPISIKTVTIKSGKDNCYKKKTARPVFLYPQLLAITRHILTHKRQALKPAQAHRRLLGRCIPSWKRRCGYLSNSFPAIAYVHTLYMGMAD